MSRTGRSGPSRRLALGRPSTRAAVDWELEHHVEELADRLEAEGMGREAARAEARRRIGDLEELRRELEMVADHQGRWTMGGWIDEVRDALRGLIRRPGVALGVVGMLAVASTVTLTTWTVVDGVLWRPPPFPDPERLVEVMGGPEPGGFLTPSLALDHARRWAETDLWESSGLHRRMSVVRTDRGRPESWSAQAMTPDAMALLGVTPSRGRLFLAEDAVPGAPPVAVVPEVTARELGEAGPVLGTRLVLNGLEVEVVGVLPDGVRYPMAFGSDVFLPMADDGSALGGSASRVELIGRVATDVEIVRERARALFDSWQTEDATIWWISPSPIGAHRANPDVRRNMLLIVGAVVFLYLVALINGAHILVIQAMGRTDEEAVRLSLGSSLGRVRRAWGLRAAALGGASVLLGWLGALLLTGPVLRRVPGSIAFMVPDGLAPDQRVALLGAGLALAATAALALLPSTTLGRIRPAGTLTAGSASRGSAGRTAVRLRNGLVAAQVALSLLLLSAAGVLARSYRSLATVDMGFAVDGIAFVSFTLPEGRYPDAGSVWTTAEALRERVAALPGVRSASITDGAPAKTGFSFGVTLEAEGREPLPGRDDLLLPSVSVDLHGVDALGLELISGRTFEATDLGTARVLIDEPLARALWGDVASGRRFRTGERSPWYEVIGVVRDLRLFSPDDSETPYDIVHLASTESRPWSTFLVARTDGDPSDLLPLLRDAVFEMDPGIPPSNLGTARNALAEAIHMERFVALVLLGLAGSAVLVAVLGLYATVTYSVVRRMRELGIRVALGADAARLRGVVLRQGMGTILVGTVVGLAIAILGLRLLDLVVYGVPPVDPVALVGSAAILVLLGAMACVPPAQRAASTDPAEVLRRD